MISPNITSLNDDVCKHFNVNKTSEISEDELTEWIELSIQSGKYIIEAFDIDSTEKIFKSRIAFRIKDK